MKEYNDQLLKIKVTNNKLKMEISLKDLVELFEQSPNNTYDGENTGVKVKRGKRQEFAQFIVENLLDDSSIGDYGDGLPVWGVPFEEVFMRIIEGAEDDFCKYMNEYEDGE